MKIVIDNKIPYIRETMARITPHAVYINGGDISNADLRDADALIVRTRTRCDERLLHDTGVRFVATATIGYDHIDTGYLERAGIAWMNCPGCNASSVAQYLRSSLIHLLLDGVISPGDVVGIVGCGHVGGRVKTVAEELGLRTMVCDPPLQASSGSSSMAFADLHCLAEQCEVITFHVPLTMTGDCPTYHMADEPFFRSLKRRPVIINTARGAVVDNGALLRALDDGLVRLTVIDTWENEPDISVELLDKAYIATPHIAGYSADGKVNADNMVVDGLCRFFGIPRPPMIVPPPAPYSRDEISALPPLMARLRLYDPLDDTRRLKADPQAFEQLRGSYPVRREHL